MTSKTVKLGLKKITTKVVNILIIIAVIKIDLTENRLLIQPPGM
jgi:hypothetical protein